MFVVRAKEYRHIPYRSLKHVVNANTETTANISYVTIIIYRRQQAEAIDDKTLGIGSLLG